MSRQSIAAAVALLLVMASAIWIAQTAIAQSLPKLTAAQQNMLNALPAAQRDALVRRYLGNAAPSPAANPTTPATPARGVADDDFEPLPAEIVLGANDTIVLLLDTEPSRQYDDDALATIEKTNARNPFRLDRRGQLTLPGMPEIVLAGLTESQALLRLQAEPGLAVFNIQFFLLPVDDPDGPELEAFGYNVFTDDPQRFEINESLAIPTDYTVGPGDNVNVQFFGSTNTQYSVVIDRDGMLNLPELGPLQAAGLTFNALREEIRLRVSNKLIGSDVSVTLGELRSVRVFLLGDVLEPGAYQVSAYAGITSILALGGGIAETGSLRDIQLKRDGRVVSRLDLYDLLLKGDASGDRRVANGDVVFVPTVGPRVSVFGQVRRPAVYEYRDSLTVAQAIRLAGGSLPTALTSSVRIERISPETGTDVFEVDLATRSQAAFAIRPGDRVYLAGDVEQLDRAVTLTGLVSQGGLQQWFPGLRLSDVLRSSKDVRPRADIRYVVITRQQSANGPIDVISADLAAIWNAAPGARDPELMARDEITVFPMDEERDAYLEPILERLRMQSRAQAPTSIVSVDGQVKHPGPYPLEAGMTVTDLIRAGGGLSESAYLEAAELRRHTRDSNDERVSQLRTISLLADDSRGDAMTMLLEPFDHLNVKEVPNWGDQRFMDIRGDVTFPGRYSLSRGETLSSVLQRAGGLTETSFASGTILTRKTLRERERKQLDELASRIESDLATLALSNPDRMDGQSTGQSLLHQIRTTEPTGRLVIDMESIIAGEKDKDVFVRDQDVLYVPQQSQEVTVIGEVQYATSHLYENGLDRQDYISRSGGITAKADRKRIYIVRASGEVVISQRSRFYGRADGNEIRPGDTIVVPLKTDRVAPLVLWSSATQIIYNLAIAAAAVGSF